jgi:ribosomal protein L11 methyltransferase
MTKVSCLIEERFVNPLFEVFDGGDFILSSYRDVEESETQVQIYFAEAERVPEAEKLLSDALSIVGVKTEITVSEIPDEDWKLSYRRHFKTEVISPRLTVRPPWEPMPETAGAVVTLDPGMAFGTGKHETTRACLEYIDELSPAAGGDASSMLDMGSGSGILSIAAAKLGYTRVRGFDVDQEAVDASKENAALNAVEVEYVKYALGGVVKREWEGADLVVANILGPLLIRFADEIVPAAKSKLVISGILTEIYPEVLDAYVKRGFTEISRKTLGEWTTGLLRRKN